ncbi:hypothetical protein LCGC14_1961050 [marine sediment metagenome]|uniref:Uncharacterized protein n=1 Tax=marine sediment metagenome TaxID=412755 RepID=A0A0F9FEU3_9ZZZZ
MYGSMASNIIKKHFKFVTEISKKYKKPFVCICFGSKWTFDFLKKATSNLEVKIPLMTRIKYAIKAFKFMYEYRKSLLVRSSE